MEKELEQALKEYQIKKDFERDAIPTVWKLHQEWCKKNPNSTRYLSTIQEYILSKENIPTELHEQLHHEIYLANHQEDSIKEQKHHKEMLSQGFLEAKNTDYRGKAILKGTQCLDWLSKSYEITGKIITGGDLKPFFLPKGKRSRGFRLDERFEGYYKPL